MTPHKEKPTIFPHWLLAFPLIRQDCGLGFCGKWIGKAFFLAFEQKNMKIFSNECNIPIALDFKPTMSRRPLPLHCQHMEQNDEVCKVAFLWVKTMWSSHSRLACNIYVWLTFLSLCQLNDVIWLTLPTKVDSFCNKFWWCLLLKHTSSHYFRRNDLFHMRYGTMKSYMLSFYVKDVQSVEEKNVGTWLVTL